MGSLGQKQRPLDGAICDEEREREREWSRRRRRRSENVGQTLNHGQILTKVFTRMPGIMFIHMHIL